MIDMTYDDIDVTRPAERVCHIRINRPEVRNALRTQTLTEIADALAVAAADETVGAVVISGDSKAFAAGADIREMADLGAIGVWRSGRPAQWQRIADFEKPLIGAVNGYCLGGGCELALACDLLIAGDDAVFGQPEIKLGIMPGGGGTQRLIRAVGKAFAMQMVLSGMRVDATTAERRGLVAEAVPADQALPRALEVAADIAGNAPLALAAAKKALNQAFEAPLSAGLDFERQCLALLSASEDRNEGIAAFLEKRKPVFRGR